MKRLLLIICLALQSLQFFQAQQEPFFSQFWESYNYLNPAQIGMRSKHNAAMLGRLEWEQLLEKPAAFLASYGFLSDKLKGGIGFSYMRENFYGLVGDKFKVAYNYQIQLPKEYRISIGLSSGIHRESWDFTGNSNFFRLDPDQVGLTADAGIALTGEKINVGISLTQLASIDLKNTGYDERPNLSTYFDYYAGRKEKLSVETHILFQSDFSMHRLDVNVLAQYKQKAFAGMSYHTNGVVSWVAGWDFLKKIRLAYGLDYVMSKLNNGGNFVNELQLGLRL